MVSSLLIVEGGTGIVSSSLTVKGGAGWSP